MEDLLGAWPQVEARVRAAPHVFLFCDFDGTLAPIAPTPDAAQLSAGARALLGRLARHRRCTVGVISGRALDDLKQRVGLQGILYAGNHGFEVEGPGVHFLAPDAQEAAPVMRQVERELAAALAGVPGALVEPKGPTLSVHYRLVSQAQVPAVERAFAQVVGPLAAQGKVRVTHGKKVLEVRPPAAWHKGKAVTMLLERLQADPAALVVYLGDDVTDEDAFRAIADRPHLAVLVGDASGPTAATLTLRDVGQVEEFLGRLERALADPADAPPLR